MNAYIVLCCEVRPRLWGVEHRRQSIHVLLSSNEHSGGQLLPSGVCPLRYDGRCVGKIKLDTVPYPSVERGTTTSQNIWFVVVACRGYTDQAAVGKVDRDCDIVQREPRCAVHDRVVPVALSLGGEPKENWANIATFRHQPIIVTVVCRLDPIRVRSGRVNVLLEAAASSRSGNVPGRIGVDNSKRAIGLRLNRSGIGPQSAVGEERSGTLRTYQRRKSKKKLGYAPQIHR